jgi:hypothetical protein
MDSSFCWASMSLSLVPAWSCVSSRASISWWGAGILLYLMAFSSDLPAAAVEDTEIQSLSIPHNSDSAAVVHISGRVTDKETGQPISEALVSLGCISRLRGMVLV